MALVGSTNEEKIWNYLKAQGLNDCGCAGLMGNLYIESKLDPVNMQNSYEKKLGMTDEDYCKAVDEGTYSNFVHDGVGWGLAQWTHWSRKKALYEFAKLRDRSIGDLETQLAFLLEEMTKGYKSVLEMLKTAESVLEASNAVMVKYERPADQSDEAQSRRAEYGMAYFEKYATVQEMEVIPMKIDVNKLLDLFEKMYKEKWKYVWGGAKKGTVDCSGAFVYAYKTLANLSLYHSSNMIPRRNCGTLQKNTTNKAPAGYAAFKHRTQTDSALIKKYGTDDYYHIGLVDRTGEYVLNAKGTKYGFCRDKLDSSWDYVAPLTAVDYGAVKSEEIENEVLEPLFTAMVTTKSGSLNLRNTPGGKKIGTLKRNTTVDVLKDDNSDWWYVMQGNLIGYASTDYLTKCSGSVYTVKVTADVLNIREGAGTNYKRIGKIKDKGTYVIVEEKDGQGATKWLRLASGGWIASDYCE